MADFIFIVITIAFVALCVAYVYWCERIMGGDELVAGPTATDTDEFEA